MKKKKKKKVLNTHRLMQSEGELGDLINSQPQVQEVAKLTRENLDSKFSEDRLQSKDIETESVVGESKENKTKSQMSHR
jgi:predicted SAM-dependent methyltransferase